MLYRFAGTPIFSDLALPEWAPFRVNSPEEMEEKCLRFELRAPAPLPAPTKFEVEGATCQFVVPEVALYRVENGERVVIVPAPDAQEREIRLFLLGSAWGILCYQRGVFALHAGVVRAQDARGNAGCLAFCGESGAGKSSAVAWLLARGYELWSDDLCALELENAPRVWPSTRRLKLWDESLRALGHDASGWERDHFRQDKFHWNWGADSGDSSLAEREPLPLRAIFLLQWGEIGCQRLSGLEALENFVRAATYRGTVLSDMGRAPAYWAQCAQIVRETPVFRLTRPRDWAQLPSAMAPILENWPP